MPPLRSSLSSPVFVSSAAPNSARRDVAFNSLSCFDPAPRTWLASNSSPLVVHTLRLHRRANVAILRSRLSTTLNQCGKLASQFDLVMSQIPSLSVPTHVAIPAMNDSSSEPPIEGSVIRSIVLVDQVTRPTANLFQSTSPPGHLLHLMLAGEVEQEVSGQIQRLRPGLGAWYFENEPVRGKIVQAPWTFLTVNFLRRGCLPRPTTPACGRPAAEPPSCFRNCWPRGGPARRR